jgi:hypothetical protein
MRGCGSLNDGPFSLPRENPVTTRQSVLRLCSQEIANLT